MPVMPGKICILYATLGAFAGENPLPVKNEGEKTEYATS
jgi:hypothetical protein